MKKICKYLKIIPYLGIVLIALAMTFGHFYNWRGKAVLLTTDKTNVFITKDNEIKITPFTLTLAEFNISHYDTGEPKSYEAIIAVEIEENSRLRLPNTIRLLVNHPHKMGFGECLYLLNYTMLQPENEPCCVVELVYEPFQTLFLVGIILLIIGLLLLLVNPKK